MFNREFFIELLDNVDPGTIEDHGDTGQEDAMRSHPALIEQIARIIHRDHLPYDQAERRNTAGWELAGGRRHTLADDELAEAYAEAMRRDAADRAARRSGRPPTGAG